MTKKTIALFFVSFLFVATTFAQAPRSYTSSEILLQLKKLNTVGSVLYVAAHPDDENTRLIAYLANEKCLRTGYLSLTRGDGGQNLIGPEQGVELGVIRTQELLAARRIDGGEQFFTRAYDFGFSKSPEETLQKWNKDSILSDMVWVIRNFRPDIIITRFATDGSGGHGHHTTSAILAEEAFDAAGDPTRFPEQLQHVDVWTPRRLFWNVSTRFQNPNADMSPYLKLDVGGYNPLLGKSYGEIAAESRSMHKSQGFGSAKQRGEYFEYFKPIKGDTANLKDIFEGIDFSWKRVKGGDKIGAMIEKIIKNYKIESPNKSTIVLLNLANQINYNSSIDRGNIQHKSAELNNIIANCEGVFIEASYKDYYLSSNEKIECNLNVINRSDNDLKINKLISLGTISGNGGAFMQFMDTTTVKNKVGNLTFSSRLNAYSYPSIPDYLTNPITNNLFNPLTIYGATKAEDKRPTYLSISREQFKINLMTYDSYKWVDPEKGELYRPVVITPPVMINTNHQILVFKEDKGIYNKQVLEISIKAGRDSLNGLLIFQPDSTLILKFSKDGVNFYSPTEESGIYQKIYITKKSNLEKVYISIQPKSQFVKPIQLKIGVIVDSVYYSKGIKEIKYDHIPVQTLFPEAEVKLVKLDVVKKSKRIGYIPGAGDEVQACLSQLGYKVTTLTDDKLATENLSVYDAVITGVRAYNTNPKLLSFKQKLMDYVAAGGNLIVQYNTNSWAGPLSSDIGPYKFKITRNRITDEEAKVNFLLPNHPVFNSPNKITEKDFEGWMQERSIYHAGDWDSNYVAPISMTDPYEMTVGGVSPKGKPDNGALIIAKHGKGNFVYTGLVFFRQLPAGVPGAYRFLVNLIELGK